MTMKEDEPLSVNKDKQNARTIIAHPLSIRLSLTLPHSKEYARISVPL